MGLEDLLSEVTAELASETEQAMTTDERVLHEIAQKLLILQRDLRAPGTIVSSDARADRILELIAKENF